MTGATIYEVRFTRSARRSLSTALPPKVAAAAFNFIHTTLVMNPHRLGKQLGAPLFPLYSARRGEYRVIYAIFEDIMVIEIVSVVHRRSAYRTP